MHCLCIVHVWKAVCRTNRMNLDTRRYKIKCIIIYFILGNSRPRVVPSPFEIINTESGNVPTVISVSSARVPSDGVRDDSANYNGGGYRGRGLNGA